MSLLCFTWKRTNFLCTDLYRDHHSVLSCSLTVQRECIRDVIPKGLEFIICRFVGEVVKMIFHSRVFRNPLFPLGISLTQAFYWSEIRLNEVRPLCIYGGLSSEMQCTIWSCPPHCFGHGASCMCYYGMRCLHQVSSTNILILIIELIFLFSRMCPLCRVPSAFVTPVRHISFEFSVTFNLLSFAMKQEQFRYEILFKQSQIWRLLLFFVRVKSGLKIQQKKRSS